MLIHVLYLAAGLLLVIKGGDLFVDASTHISSRLHIPRIVVGGTIVSIATTVPELVVSATASFMGDSGIAIGNAMGLYRHGFLGQPGECIHAAVVSANARRTTAGARKPSRSINHCWL